MLSVRIAGGTNAGWKRPLTAHNRSFWICPECDARNKYYWLKCPNCGHRRPE